MSDLVNYEYPPPRSWEQFEELCADLFEAMWSDPRVVRHGRAGQAQCGVDIIAARGSIYPVGLQCKKKSRWPAKSLTKKEVDCEIAEAENFKPRLKEFYILTTAAPDTALEEYVRKLNESRKTLKKFEVVVLFWPEIVRRVARLDQVAMKHFPLRGGRGEFSPLLATWYTRAGSLELKGEDWNLAVAELGEDLQEWPTGRVVVRERETDEIEAQLRSLSTASTAYRIRRSRLELRSRLRYAQEREHRIQNLIQMLYTNECLKFYVLDSEEIDASEILKSIIEDEMRRESRNAPPEKIRVTPPTPHLLSGPRLPSSLAGDYISVRLPVSEFQQIRDKEKTFPLNFHGNRMQQIVLELPRSVRSRYVISAILRQILAIMKNDHKSLLEMQIAGYLDLNAWAYSY